MRKVIRQLAMVFAIVLGPLITAHVMAPSHQLTQPNVIVEVFDHSLDPFVPMWQKEVGRRFSNTVVVLCHGGDFVRGEWVVGSQPGSGHIEKVDDVLARVKAQYPGRQLVLLACNTGHLTPKISGVYYATASVWCIPDRAITPELMQNHDALLTLDGESQNRWTDSPDVVGNIFEFIRS